MSKPLEMRDTLWSAIQDAKKAKGNGEAVLLMMAWLADEIKVGEQGGNNHGPWVKRFLASCGLDEGNPWCAATISWCCDALTIPRPAAGAAVRMWVEWAHVNGKLRKSPNAASRGLLCYFLHADGTGHIGIVSSATGNSVSSIEGNTGPGDAGSQRDGDGLFRRTRAKTVWDGYIQL